MSRPKEQNSLHGIVVVDKHAGITSHDVVNMARKLYGVKRIGHTGTLDPDATGIMVLCIGNATRLAQYLSAAYKHYTAEIVFGVTTSSQDASGEILTESDALHLTQAEIETLLPRFRGTIFQIPPMVSALHHQGKRLYELAREGITVEREARQVEISSLEMTEFRPGRRASAILEITCSTGTYIRTLAHDLGEAAQTGGMMNSLRRTWVGDSDTTAYHLSEAHSLYVLGLRADAGTLMETILPMQTALRDWPMVTPTESGMARLRHGQPLSPNEFLAHNSVTLNEMQLTAVLDDEGQLQAIAKFSTGELRPVKVLNQS